MVNADSGSEVDNDTVAGALGLCTATSSALASTLAVRPRRACSLHAAAVAGFVVAQVASTAVRAGVKRAQLLHHSGVTNVLRKSATSPTRGGSISGGVRGGPTHRSHWQLHAVHAQAKTKSTIR